MYEASSHYLQHLKDDEWSHKSSLKMMDAHNPISKKRKLMPQANLQANLLQEYEDPTIQNS